MLYVLPPPPWAAGGLCAAPRPPHRRRRPQRPLSAAAADSSSSLDSGAGGSLDEEDGARGSNATNTPTRSLSECYFAGKGAALVLPPTDRVRTSSRRVSSDIQQHLQSMFYLLRAQDTLKMAVKLESAHPNRTRYLVVVSCTGRGDAEESALLGIDCNQRTTVGLVLKVLADTSITLDGDGGFSVSVCGRQHIFKPVSVQAMWSALQTLHRVSSKAREHNHFLGGLTHDWVAYYEQRVESDRSCLNEWHAMDNLESRRPPSPDSVRTKPREREETEHVIRSTLKEIMMSVDLDEVTSKYIRSRLEEDLDMDLGEFKSFIDQEMLTILGQMDAATEIFEHVYLGSEWNASNLEELQRNGVRHILNVTREIDNFFPGMFNYQNIRVYDDEKTDLLKHWDNTFRYITSAKKEGSKVLVHCKMGVSRSASVVIAYAMKAYNWDYKKAFEYVKQKRSCIKPNTSFISQLETYQGMLDAMKHRERLQRSKSETNLGNSPASEMSGDLKDASENRQTTLRTLTVPSSLTLSSSGRELAKCGNRPKSWSPDNAVASSMFAAASNAPSSVSLERLDVCCQQEQETVPQLERSRSTTSQQAPHLPHGTSDAKNVRMPCVNGEAYSVSQNKVVYLPTTETAVKRRVSELEARSRGITAGVSTSEVTSHLQEQPTAPGSTPMPSATALPVPQQQVNTVPGGHFLPPGLPAATPSVMAPSPPQSPQPATSPSSPPSTPTATSPTPHSETETIVQTKLAPRMLKAVLVKKEIWDPGETRDSPTACTAAWPTSYAAAADDAGTTFVSELRLSDQLANGDAVQKGVGRRDPFSAQLDRVFDREERRPYDQRECPSRQSSWSSYDSAVVLGYQGERDTPSRQSSWGSGDTGRWAASRNSSWGSYDMRPPPSDHLGSAATGTVKRQAKQKLEQGAGVKRVCGSPSESVSGAGCPHGPCPYLSVTDSNTNSCNHGLFHCASSPALCGTQGSVTMGPKPSGSDRLCLSAASLPLSVSAPAASPAFRSSEPPPPPSPPETSDAPSPCVIGTTQCPSVKQQRLVLENLSDLSKRSRSGPSDTPAADGLAGIVKNLKKEFEAKSSGASSGDVSATHSDCTSEGTDKKVRSLPSSPVSGHHSSTNMEDTSVRKLVGHYEARPPHRQRLSSEGAASAPPPPPPLPPPPPPSSSSMVTAPQPLPRARPVPLSVSSAGVGVGAVAAAAAAAATATAVVAAAGRKLQQGKTHPLTRLAKPRHSNPVYNTM
ncbi:uncharacterized protein LOC126175859 isoform X1 [Schistocerca cancellata]|uniref:uncharacterized protein LOC126175859 isoform X1 n=1 Tax=Schistocerca cancellata TaxID=274614 RepID=UPI002117A9FF|nr:uncharacterized protein LOC126175859 isoform X1 [Schistocerca cancellata]